jgi:hypothetical protein
MKRAFLIFTVSLLAACASHTPPPDWLLRADAAREAHARFWLEGHDKLADGQLALAREAVRQTGDASAMARIELHACAVRMAALGAADCPAFAALAGDAGRREQVYGAYLAGHLDNADIGLLPEAQALAWRNPAALKELADPLSRLLAAAVLFRSNRLPPEGIALAIDTASAQGWRRPLLAWLTLERERRQRGGDAEGAAAIERRLSRIVGEQR